MESIKKSIDERALDKSEYDSRVNERQMHTKEEKVDTSKALDASLVNTKSKGQNQESRIQAVDQEMMHMLMMQISNPYMMKSQWPSVAKLLKENETLKKHYKELYDSIKTKRAQTIEQKTYLIAQNAQFKAQLQEKGFTIAALKNELRKLTRNSVNTKFARTSILGKLI
nr:hypothetical protein [Tanacetum cinerariifolium]